MKKLFITTGVLTIAFASQALAGAITWEPSPEVTESGDATAALVLLGLIGMVIASAQLTGRAKAPLPEPIIIDEENN